MTVRPLTWGQEVGSSNLLSPTQVPVLCAFMADDEHLRAELRYAQLEAHRSRRRSLLVAITTSVVIVLALVAYNTQNAQRDLWSDVIGGLVAGVTIASLQLVSQEHVRRRAEVRRLTRELGEHP